MHLLTRLRIVLKNSLNELFVAQSRRVRLRSFFVSWIKFYWTGRSKAPVTISDHAFIWAGVYGIRIGLVFIGVVIGDSDA